MKLKQLLAGILPLFLLTHSVFGQVVSGPLISTNRSVAVFNSSNGKQITSSPVMIDIVGNIWFAGPGSLIANDMTTAERTSLSPTNGMIIYNSTTSQFERYQAGAWGPFGSGSGSTNGTPEYVNGILLSGPINITNSSTLTWSVTGTNVSATPVNLTSAQLATDSVSADELNALGVEAELESVLDLQDLQGAVTDAQVPDNITITLYVNGSSITGHRFTNSPTAFFDVSSLTNITVNPTNLANAQISAAAAIAKTKISTNGAWSALELGTGTADTNTFLRGDQTWTRNGGSFTNLTTSNLVNLAAGAVLIGQGAGPVGGAITSNTNYVLHGGSSAAFSPISSADIATATNFGGVRFSVEPINSSLIFDAVVRETSGYVSNGLTALTVTGGSFVAGDVGKTIQVWQPDRVLLDAYITNGTAVLISTNAAFTAADLGKTVEVSGAGAGAVSLISTVTSVDSAIQVTLVGNAGTTVSNATARIISIPLVTTIAAVGGSTTATLTAGPSVTQTNAHVIYGTDNRAAFSNDVGVAQASNRRIVLGSGKAMVLLTSTNSWGTALSTNSLVIAGKDRRTTEIITIWNSIPSTNGGLIRVSTGGSLGVSDMTFRGYGPMGFTNNNGIINSPMTLQVAGGGPTQYFDIRRVDIFGMSGVATFLSGTANTRYFRAEDCRWVCGSGLSFFTVNGGTYERRMRDVYIESTHPMTTAADDSIYNNHVFYDHPNVAEDWTDVTTKADAYSTGSLYHLHYYGSPTDQPAFLRFTRTRHLGYGTAFLFTTTGTRAAEFIDPIFETASSGVISARDVDIIGGQTRMTNQGTLLSAYVGTSGQHFRVIGHDYYNTNTLAAMCNTVSNSTVEISGCRITGLGTQLQGPSSRITHVGTTFVGVSPVTIAGTYSFGSNSIVKFIGCTFQGAYTVSCIAYGASSVTNIDLEVANCRNDTSAPLVKDFSATGNGGKAYGGGNYFSVSGGEPESTGRLGNHFASRQMLNPDTIASASSISPSFNFNSHQITGSTTINTILVGGSAARNLVAYEITLIPATSATWALGSAGNIVALSASARTAGQAYTFRWDSIDQKWRETGLPGSSAVTEVFTNAPNVFSANASNTYNGAVRFVGRVQFPAVPLTGTTIDGSTNSLLLTLTTNAVLDWAGVDGDDVVVEALQDGVGGHTMTINNVGLWNNTNQSTVMPLIDTNANNRSWIHLWRHGSTSEGSVYTTPSQWEMDWARMAATSAQVRAAVTDPTGTGALVFGTSPTLTTPTIASFANANHNHQNSAGGGTLAEAALALTDVTTANATTSAHGFMPKLNGNTNTFYNGNGGFTTPPGSGGTPGGTNGDVQFNSNGVFVAESAFNYNSTNKTLTVPRIATTNIVVSGPTNGTWTWWDGDGGESVIVGAPPAVVTNGTYYWPIQPDTGLYFGTNLNGVVQQGILQHPAANGKMLYTTNAPFGGYFWADPPAGTVIPTGTVVNTGASVVSQLSRHTDTTGTNVAPSLAQVDAVGGMTLTNTVNTNVALTVNGFSGTTNDVVKVTAGGTNYFKVNSKGQILSIDGLNATPSYAFLNAQDTGMRWRNPGLSFSVGTSEKLIILAAGITANNVPIDINAASTPYLSILSDTYIGRDAVNSIQLGLDAATPSAQTLKGPDGLGTDKAGGDISLAAGTSTGTGRAGALIFKSGETSTTGLTTNASVVRFYASAKGVDLTGGSATLVFNISLASGKTCGLHVFATTRVNDGTDFQSATDDFTAAAVNKGGTVSIGSLSTSLGSTIATSGTISTVWTAVANGNGIDVKCNETSTVITPTVRKVKWRVEVDTDDTGAVITPQ